MDSDNREGWILGYSERFDVRSTTWSAWVDWMLMAAGLTSVAVTLALASGGPWAGLAGILPAAAISRWRATRLAWGVEEHSRKASGPELTVAVSDRDDVLAPRRWPGVIETLAIGNGWVRLADESWPAVFVGTVDVNAPGILISIPGGARLISVLPGIDPASPWSTLVDCAALPLLRGAIRSASSTPRQDK